MVVAKAMLHHEKSGGSEWIQCMYNVWSTGWDQRLEMGEGEATSTVMIWWVGMKSTVGGEQWMGEGWLCLGLICPKHIHFEAPIICLNWDTVLYVECARGLR